MREIKFRALAKFDKQWVFGWYVERDGYDKGMIYESNGVGHDVFRETRSQYIGQKDRGGQEIYEGDIIDFAGIRPIEIVWENIGFTDKQHNFNFTPEGTKAFARVIGNIYQNPNLLP